MPLPSKGDLPPRRRERAFWPRFVGSRGLGTPGFDSLGRPRPIREQERDRLVDPFEDGRRPDPLRSHRTGEISAAVTLAAGIIVLGIAWQAYGRLTGAESTSLIAVGILLCGLGAGSLWWLAWAVPRRAIRRALHDFA